MMDSVARNCHRTSIISVRNVNNIAMAPARDDNNGNSSCETTLRGVVSISPRTVPPGVQRYRVSVERTPLDTGPVHCAMSARWAIGAQMQHPMQMQWPSGVTEHRYVCILCQGPDHWVLDRVAL